MNFSVTLWSTHELGTLQYVWGETQGCGRSLVLGSGGSSYDTIAEIKLLKKPVQQQNVLCRIIKLKAKHGNGVGRGREGAVPWLGVSQIILTT